MCSLFLTYINNVLNFSFGAFVKTEDHTCSVCQGFSGHPICAFGVTLVVALLAMYSTTVYVREPQLR